jgi:hypothetical protein
MIGAAGGDMRRKSVEHGPAPCSIDDDDLARIYDISGLIVLSPLFEVCRVTGLQLFPLHGRVAGDLTVPAWQGPYVALVLDNRHGSSGHEEFHRPTLEYLMLSAPVVLIHGGTAGARFFGTAGRFAASCGSGLVIVETLRQHEDAWAALCAEIAPALRQITISPTRWGAAHG